MKPDILLLEAMMPEIEAKLDAAYTMHRATDPARSADAIAQVADRVRGIVTGGGLGAANAMVDRLPKLEIIAINGVGTDAVDLAHARERGVRVTNTPDVLTDDVADLGMALILAASRQLVAGDRFVREGHWARGEGIALARKVRVSGWASWAWVASGGRSGDAHWASACRSPIQTSGRLMTCPTDSWLIWLNWPKDATLSWSRRRVVRSRAASSIAR